MREWTDCSNRATLSLWASSRTPSLRILVMLALLMKCWIREGYTANVHHGAFRHQQLDGAATRLGWHIQGFQNHGEAKKSIKRAAIYAHRKVLEVEGLASGGSGTQSSSAGRGLPPATGSTAAPGSRTQTASVSAMSRNLEAREKLDEFNSKRLQLFTG